MTKGTILIVEDENIIARDIQNKLKRLGYTVSSVVSSGEEAIKKVHEAPPNLVLMDIMLNGDIDGIETAEKIRSLVDIPVVFLTAYADERTLQRAKITEPFGYILKPFSVKDLHSTIEMALYKHQMDQTLQRSHDELERRVKEQTADLRLANKQLQAEIGERVRAEERLHESNLLLEDTLAELQGTQQQIIQQERLSALGQMASGIAHDFNNALSPIMGFSEVLLAHPEDLNDTEKATRYLEIIQTAAKDAASVVNRLREFYRHRQTDEIFHPINLN